MVNLKKLTAGPVSGRFLICALVLLAVSILLFPVRLKFGYLPIESPTIFPNIALFAVLFYAFIIILFIVTMFIKPKSNVRVRLLFFACLFSLVYLGSYVFYSTPATVVDYESGGLGYVNYINLNGVIPQFVGNSSDVRAINFGYLEFPFTSILGSAVSQVFNISALDFRDLILIYNCLALAIFLYLSYERLLSSTKSAFLATVIAILGSEIVGGVIRYLPSGEAILFSAILLFLITRNNGAVFERKRDKVIVGIFMAAVTIAHLPTAVAFCFIFSGIAVFFKLTERNEKGLLTVSLLFISIILFWLSYTALITLNSLIQVNFWQSYQEGFINFSYIGQRAITYLGPEVPFWVTVTRLFWLILLFALPTLLASKQILRPRDLSYRKALVTGALLGVIVFSIGAILLSSNQGGFQFYRYFAYAGFLLAPILLSLTDKGRYAKYLLVCLVIVTVVLSFPTYLAHNPHPNISQFFPEDFQSAKFLAQNYPPGGSIVHTFVDPDTGYLLTYYVPQSDLARAPYPPDQITNDDFAEKINTYYWGFESVLQGNHIFVHSPRISVRYENVLGVSPDDPALQNLQNMLNTKDMRLYDNGFIEIYKPKK
jgi:hypothetical protein